jgi:hypothetical protein
VSIVVSVVDKHAAWSDFEFGISDLCKKASPNPSEGYYDETLVEFLEIKTQKQIKCHCTNIPAVPEGWGGEERAGEGK